MAALLLLHLSFSLPVHALQGGTAANASDYPGLVMLSFEQVPNTLPLLEECSGIVLEARRILTFADCLNTNSSTFPYPDVPIPPNKIKVHPVLNGEVGGTIRLPVINPSVTPQVGVSSYVIHPENTLGLPDYGLAILYLSGNIGIEPAYFYDGNNNFAGKPATALGWEREERTFNTPFPVTTYYYVLRKLSFNLVEGDSNFNGLCYDSNPDSQTVFCGGFRNALKFLQSQDEGAPIYRKVNSRQTVIGILADASNGLFFQGKYDYEKFTRIATLKNFIRQHAPNTQFWNESSVLPEPDVDLTPILWSLLLAE